MMPFNALTTSFDPQNALVLAQASRAAYGTEEAARSWAADAGFPNFAWFNVGGFSHLLDDLQGFAASNRDAAILAFRGSSSTLDWMTDFRATPVRYDWIFSGGPQIGEIHAGFGHQICDALDIIVDAVEQVAPRSADPAAPAAPPLWIGGHSLGGGLALIAASVFLFLGGKSKKGTSILRPVNGIYTFGQPRVGLHNFCGQYDRLLHSRTTRFVNNQDLVPRVPFRGWDYGDCGEMIHFDTDGVAQIESPQWSNFLSRTLDSFSDVRQIFTHLGGDAGDHSMDHYLQFVTANQQRMSSADFLARLR